ncbi:phosphotyrosine protein phosphatase [Paucibacter aquatile]|uniref:Phosphotyrosine protein phosphatase n=1 Tax=Kinneretia aquatilis TaxID=2070761 RepID=A0A2N8KZP2_9BURK|nr:MULTISPECIES: low molecular weight protein tyrosine phosphatase family protein [Roseateles]MCV2362986.1 low molecular weight protein tyrosine phosphatase family protein [Paucibacter sp. DJ1R-11]PND38923.1 phosphotyrosine protein phosphatase [Paucibacter aquatile]
MQGVLFICSMNRWRSPTAEQIFSEHPGIECSSAGLNHGAENPLTPELLAWADLIFVMERSHKDKLARDFKPHLLGKRVICLNIPDNYKFMDPALVKLLHAKVDRFLPRAAERSA